jgi:hypothetical protein
MRLLPEEKVPRVDSDGQRYRELQLVYQLPKQDLDEGHCHHLGASPECRAAFRDFGAARDDVALDVAVAAEVRPVSASGETRCAKCGLEIAAGSLAVMAPRVGVQSAWHPACFTCSTCDELLVGLGSILEWPTCNFLGVCTIVTTLASFLTAVAASAFVAATAAIVATATTASSVVIVVDNVVAGTLSNSEMHDS